MRFGRYGTSHLILRVGLGATFLWIGIDSIRHPTIWVGYVPSQILGALDPAIALQVAGGFNVVIGILLAFHKFPRLVSGLAATYLAFVLITNGVTAVTIRDIGLFSMALALFFWPHRGHRRHWWQRRRRSHTYEEGDE